MRRVVVSDDYRETEILPTELFTEYLKLTELEIQRLMIKGERLVEVPCPSCSCIEKLAGFEKFGLKYVECADCQTLYVSPRPSDESIKRYAQESKAKKFWYSQIVKDTLQSRLGHLCKPRTMWVANMTKEYCKDAKVFVDVNSMSQGFLQGVEELDLFVEKKLLAPEISVEDISGFEVINKSIFEVNPKELQVDVITAFASLGRVFSPEKFLSAIHSVLSSKGLLLFTVSASSGFDLQVLWENSKIVYPPEHINLFSVEGLEKLLKRCGFEIIELSTPGQLDVELVKNALKKNENIKINRFLSYLLKKRNDNAHRMFQEFLQQFKLSSHVRVAARKKHE